MFRQSDSHCVGQSDSELCGESNSQRRRLDSQVLGQSNSQCVEEEKLIEDTYDDISEKETVSKWSRSERQSYSHEDSQSEGRIAMQCVVQSEERKKENQSRHCRKCNRVFRHTKVSFTLCYICYRKDRKIHAYDSVVIDSQS